MRGHRAAAVLREQAVHHIAARIERIAQPGETGRLAEIMGPGVGVECLAAKKGLHIWEDHFLIECVDVDSGEPLPPGEKGEIVITSLTREAFPMMRFR
ncbi:MAG: hypothetical protein LBF51_01730, partial [Zoogloeaceae bacterium]|nr:hypothetical protein [Zoogloeaceae bacterium]